MGSRVLPFAPVAAVFFLASGATEAQQDVLVLTVTSKSETNLLEWRNPTEGPYGATRIVRRTDRFPLDADDVDGAFVEDVAGILGGRGRIDDTGLTNGTTYFYGVFVNDGLENYSPGKRITAAPFSTSGPVKWKFQPEGLTVAMTPPGIGRAVLFPSNDGNLYSIERSTDGGAWAPDFFPSSPGVVQHRPPVIPLPGLLLADVFSLVSAQEGRVHAIDATTGGSLWSSEDYGILQAGPGAWFVSRGATADTVVVGTRNAGEDNVFVGLEAASGGEVWRFDDAEGMGLGIVNGSPSIDYARGRVYFASHERSPSADTVFAVDLASGSRVWATALGDVSGSPVLRGTRLYVGADTGVVYGLDVEDGSVVVEFDTEDGVTKGFVFPDFRSDLLYLATGTNVWALRDVEPVLIERWNTTAVPGPSIVVYPPGSRFLWLGSSNGSLYQIDVTTGNPGLPPEAKSIVLGDGTAGVGSPTLDIVHGLIYVGTEDGALYAVAVPF